MSTYTEMQVFRIPNGIVHCGPPSFVLINGRQRWRLEWHPYFGPIALNKDDSVKATQPGPKSAFWLVAQWWWNQGAVVIDGIGQWQKPPRVVLYVRWVGSTAFLESGPGPDVVEELGDYDHAWKGPAND